MESLPSLEELRTAWSTVCSHWPTLSVGAVMAVLVSLIGRLRHARPYLGFLSGSAETTERGISTILLWIEIRRFGIAAFVLLASGWVALFQGYLDALRKLSPGISYGSPKTVSIPGAAERTNILIPVFVNKRLPRAIPRMISFHKEGVTCKDGSIDPVGICIAFPVRVGWNGMDSCSARSVLGSDHIVPFVLSEKEERLTLFACSELYDLHSLRTMVPFGSYTFEIDLEDDSLTSHVSQKYRLTWSSKGIDVQRVDERP